jgi:guanosine-3',5'-bis(diphosphate) 3'-pyrophosphohydrolase
MRVLKQVMKAAVFAAKRHQYQRRGGYDRLPYINHLLKVANALIQIGEEEDETLLVAAVLHDIIEDTATTEEELAREFNKEVADIVVELTDDMSLSHQVRKQLQIERATALSIRARKIRLADKASNMIDIFTYPVNWPLQKKINYVNNAEAVYQLIRGENTKIDEWMAQTISWARELINQRREV